MRSRWGAVFLLLCFFVLSFFYLSGINSPPFHPDEMSLLYQSRDLEAFLSNPLSLAWQSTPDNPYDQTYRELNAPLTKYVLGFGRMIAGFAASDVETDWDWGKSWAENDAQGALPNPRLLYAARLSVGLFFPASLILIYLSGKQLHSVMAGVIAAFILGTNALILLHTRRAMAEGVLIFGISLAIYGMLNAHKYPWIAGLGTALAVSAKYSALALLPAALLAAAWAPGAQKPDFRRSTKSLLQFVIVTAAAILLLHPILWASPVDAGLSMLHTRQRLVDEQASAFFRLAPDLIASNPAERLGVFVFHLFITPPQFQEIGNYAEQLTSAIQTYQSIPGNMLFRGPVLGGAMLTLTVFGICMGFWQAFTRKRDRRRELMLLLVATVLQGMALLLYNPLPFQRYFLPMIPMTSLWAAYGIALIIERFKRKTAVSGGSG
jgi:4-amino-4-deoxy-L-arabinose transferase-like glycosyltransferase